MSSDNNCRSPKLRFSGFTDEWKEFQFKDITFPAGKKNKQNLPYERYSISNELGFYPQSEQFEGGGGYLKDIDCSLYTIVPPHSFAYNPARINVGSIGYQDLGKDVIVSSLYEVFQTTKDCDDTFLWHWLHSDIFHRMVMDTQEGGVRQYFFYDKLCGCTILLPSLAEQQKIAECLSAVDESISAQQEKVDALKAHKKGLMQQLFPQDGETTPRLRFPGFTGEWVEKKLGEVSTFVRGLSYNKNEVINDIRATLIIRSNNIIQDGIVDCVNGLQFVTKDPSDEQILRYGDIVICLANGSSNLVGKSAFFDKSFRGTATVGTFCGILRSSAPIVKYLVQTSQYKTKISLIKQGGNGALANLYGKDILSLEFMFPSDIAEQQKITDCLSSFDDEISAEQKKLDALKDHKTGLMQQLFPQPVK